MKKDEQGKRSSLGITDILPGILANASRLPSIAASGLSTFFLFDERFHSVGKVLENNAKRYRDSIALLFEDKSWTYGELNHQANRIAHLFKSKGIAHGDTVIVYLENRAETIIITSALAKLGATASLINSNQRNEVLKHSIQLRSSPYYCIGEELLTAFEDVKAEVCVADDMLFWIADLRHSATPSNYIDLLDDSQHYPADNPVETKKVRTIDHLAYIFTSGTTGMPKASIQTHKQWLRSMHWFGNINLDMKKEDVLYVSIPLYHSNAFMIAWPSVFGAGATLALRRKFSVKEFWEDIRRFNATGFIYIGEICRYLMNAEGTDQDKMHHVVKIIGNGLRPDIWHAFKDRFGIEKIFEFYGASDSNVIFTNTFNANSTVGWSPASFAIVQYDIENDEVCRDRKGHLKKVKTGETGLMIAEITRMFPFPGYVNKKHNSEKVLTNVFKKGDQYFNTGDMMKDIGYGHVQFIDRVGDTFRWKGENVATAEIELVLNQFKLITSSAVYGVQLPNCDGRAGMAAVQTLRPIDRDEMDFLAKSLFAALPSYAVPIFIRNVSEFELTATQKIKKSKLKEEGFDLRQIDDALYVLVPRTRQYQPMTDQISADITQGRLTF